MYLKSTTYAFWIECYVVEDRTVENNKLNNKTVGITQIHILYLFPWTRFSSPLRFVSRLCLQYCAPHELPFRLWCVIHQLKYITNQVRVFHPVRCSKQVWAHVCYQWRIQRCSPSPKLIKNVVESLRQQLLQKCVFFQLYYNAKNDVITPKNEKFN